MALLLIFCSSNPIYGKITAQLNESVEGVELVSMHSPHLRNLLSPLYYRNSLVGGGCRENILNSRNANTGYEFKIKVVYKSLYNN